MPPARLKRKKKKTIRTDTKIKPCPRFYSTHRVEVVQRIKEKLILATNPTQFNCLISILLRPSLTHIFIRHGNLPMCLRLSQVENLCCLSPSNHRETQKQTEAVPVEQTTVNNAYFKDLSKVRAQVNERHFRKAHIK